jgi:hypothetical protein
LDGIFGRGEMDNMEGRRKLLEITPKGQLGAFSSRILPHPPIPSLSFTVPLFAFPVHFPSFFLSSSFFVDLPPKKREMDGWTKGGGKEEVDFEGGWRRRR